MSESASNHTISFIVPVLNGERFIGECLDYLLREAGDRDEVLVVDNGSTDGTLDIVRKIPRVRLLEVPDVTIAGLRNHGAAASSGSILAFIDADCLLCPGWREAALAALADPTVQATGSKYDIPPQATWIERAWYAKKADRPQPIHYINSGNLVVRRESFDAIKGFDERLITDEDFDFGARFRDHGLLMLEHPAVRVIHLGNAKTLPHFFRKIRWHSTSGIKLRTGRRLDKPMVMTAAFLLTWVAAAILLTMSFLDVRLIWLVPVLLLAVPLTTALYRMVQFRSVVHLPHWTVLYTVYYMARSVTFLEHLFARNDRTRRGRAAA